MTSRAHLSKETASFIPVGAGILQRKCACGGTPGPTGECEACRKKRLQRRASRSEGITQSTIAPEIIHNVLRSPGQSLDTSARAYIESRFGRDFSNVRVHTDARAAESAHSVNALAYTVGRDIVFAAGQYSPHTTAGRQLLAHELVHVVQQGSSSAQPASLQVGSETDSAEREADRMARTIERANDSGRYRPGSTEGRRLLAHELTHVVQQSGSQFSGGRVSPNIQRQSKTSSSSRPGIYQYDRSNFSNRFDGEVDTLNHRVTLTMRLAINDAVTADSFQAKWRRIAIFFMAAKDLIEKTWRNTAFSLKSSCMADRYSVRVNLLLDYGLPHQTITLWADMGERSNSTNWQLSDTNAKFRSTSVIVDPKKPPTEKGNVQQVEFSQIPVVHEFGHLMGLDHPVCTGKDDRCYGVTFEQKDDLMGYGSTIYARDMEPFIKIMKRYGQDKLPRECNDWKAVSDSD